MKQTDNQEINNIKDQLADIHATMNIGSSAFKLIYDSKEFWRFFLYTGVFSVLLPLLYHMLLIAYDTHALIPVYLKIIFYLVIFICWAFLMIIRTRISLKLSKKLGIRFTVWDMFKQLLSTKMWIAVIPVLLIAALFFIRFNASLSTADYVIYSGMAMGVVLNIIGVMIHQKEYSIAGYWMLFSALVIMTVLSLPAHIAFMVVFAPASFLFVLATKMSRKTKRGNDASI
ncbi:MAG: hypothetical protein KAQ68_09480 [Clostridiales bacterium]|nr:hypothetical protein [Clostridiales bacterium]